MSHEFFVPDSLRRPPDPILGLSKLCEQDPRSFKIDAGVGVYRDENGKTYTPQAVYKAWQSLDLSPTDYLGPSGDEEFLGERTFLQETAKLIFGASANSLLEQKRIAAVGTPGGTGAVALLMDAFGILNPGSSVLVGIPTWPNHLQILESRKIPVISYPHLKDDTYNHEGFISAIKESPPGTLVLFHTGRTHNPTGVNPSSCKEWEELAQLMEGRPAFFDTPYAGFDNSLIADTEAIRIFMQEGVSIAVAVSYAKNGGLYNERPGALLIPVSGQEQALYLQRLLNYLARGFYSSPPAHGERIMAKVFSSKDLFAQWNEELRQAAQDLRKRRQIFAQALPEFEFVERQTGLFSMLPLNKSQVEQLQKEHAVYMPRIGRVNFGGIPKKDMERFAQAIRDVGR